jgi:hypothetical protein
MKTIIKLSTIIALFILTSCSMEKRHYRSGFSFNWNAANRNTVAKKNSDKDNAPKDVISDNSESSSAETSELPVSASAEAVAPVVVKQESLLTTKSLPKDSCDVIEMKSGKKILANILEINPSTVKYKNCGDSQGPDRVISKEEIAGITYANGTKETEENMKYVAPEKPEPAVDYRDAPAKPAKPEMCGKAIEAFVFGVCSLIPWIGLPASFVAIATGFFALHKIKKNPGKYTGKSRKMAIAAVCLGFIQVLALIALVVIVFASLS